jgi:hypothetical protein
MIVRPDGSSVLLITQPDHAALAAGLMARWTTRGLIDHERRDSILHAIAEHDNGWREVDASPIVDEHGALLDFVTAPIAVRQAIWPRGARRLAADPIAAALVAEHALYIYRRFHGDPAWTAFFSDMQAIRDEFAAGADLPAADLARDYFFVRMADLMSLAFCAGWTEPQELDDTIVRLVDGQTLVVQPDPFEGTTIEFEVAARRLPTAPFASADAAADAFRNAPVEALTGRLRGQGTRRLGG